jgi:hypothetical protein
VELIRVLQYPKFKPSPADQQELLADYLPYCQIILIPESPPVTPDCRDVFDVPFFTIGSGGRSPSTNHWRSGFTLHGRTVRLPDIKR